MTFWRLLITAAIVTQKCEYKYKIDLNNAVYIEKEVGSLRKALNLFF